MSEPIYTTTTFEAPPGYRIDRAIGTCWGVLVRSVGFSKGLTGSFRSLKAGEVPQYTEAVDLARRHAVERMMAHATALGGNAVLGVKFDSVAATGGGDGDSNGTPTSEVLAYGTAVVLVAAEPSAD
ncbi:MAG: hypothetical protein QG671_4340 [Actinomycetota bacterium]|nr:hypothetical protein [Actinomycetota bacterium]